MLKKNVVFKYSNLDDVAKYINLLTGELNRIIRKQSRINKTLALMYIINTLCTVSAVNEIAELKKEIEELKEKKGV